MLAGARRVIAFPSQTARERNETSIARPEEMAKAAADVCATSLGLLQSSGASANPKPRAAPSENPATPTQNTLQPLAEVMIPTTQTEDSTPSIR
jgi:hypothetical protein